MAAAAGGGGGGGGSGGGGGDGGDIDAGTGGEDAFSLPDSVDADSVAKLSLPPAQMCLCSM